MDPQTVAALVNSPAVTEAIKTQVAAAQQNGTSEMAKAAGELKKSILQNRAVVAVGTAVIAIAAWEFVVKPLYHNLTAAE